MIKIAIHGAAGRMGQRFIALAAMDGELSLVAALESPQHSRLGEDVGVLAGSGKLGVLLTATLNVPADVVVDFSLPLGAESIIETCRQKKIPLVVATTGFSDVQTEKLHAAAREIPLLWAPNMSLAVNLAMKLAEIAATALKDKDADVEILERHHRYKEDSPSGTALKFGQIIAGVMGQTIHSQGRQGRPGKRPHNEIGYHAIRVGDNPGEHTIIFAMPGETLELTVRATNRDCYALAALAAAKFLVGKPAGLYSMNDVLGL
ncbi:MAG: 4-hydroxy-tetrahydrodipicolinate reductase [Thermoguttaceae bacterium]|jgi:4-hydroxy-tetrahydrodipicolinate reductase